MSVRVVKGGTVYMGSQYRCSLSTARGGPEHHDALTTADSPRQLNPK